MSVQGVDQMVSNRCAGQTTPGGQVTSYLGDARRLRPDSGAASSFAEGSLEERSHNCLPSNEMGSSTVAFAIFPRSVNALLLANPVAFVVKFDYK